jgi:antitoxin protein of toxin-antitoxin system
MSLVDKLRGSRSKAKQAVEQHGDKIASGLDRASGAVSKATGGRYDDKIDKGVTKAKERLDQQGGGSSAGPPPTTSGPGSAQDSSAPDDTGRNKGAGPTP